MKPSLNQLLFFIAEAFRHREMPKSVVKDGYPETDEYEDAQKFLGKKWEDLKCNELEEYCAAMAGFTPEAFCYFLPGIFSSEIRENRPNLLINDTIINTLNRSNTPQSWDNFFAARWPNLNAAECEATQMWLLWLSDYGDYEDIVLSRAFDTLNLLTNQKTAIPLASWEAKKKDGSRMLE